MDQDSVELQVQRVLDALPDAVVFVHPDGRIAWVNQQTESLFGYPRAALLGQPVEVLVPERLREVHHRHRLEYLTAPSMRPMGIGLTLVGRHHDGREFPVEISLSPLTLGEVRAILCVIRDLTERQRMEDALRTSEARYRDLFESAPDGYHTTDADGLIVEMNQTELAWLGYAREEVVGRLHYEALVTLEYQHRLSDLRATLTGVGELRDVELELMCKDGRVLPVRMNKVAVYDAAGHYRGSRASVRDITREKTLGRQMIQAQKLEIMGQVVGIVAHDLSNMLLVIQGYSALIQDSLLPGDPRHHEAEEIQQAVDRAAVLIHQLLAFGRRQTLAPQVLNLNGIVTQMEVMLQRLLGAHSTLVTMLDPALGQVEVDPDQFEQVLLNLVINARDAMLQGGTFTIETANITLEATEAWRPGALAPGPYVRLTVRDTGIGMTEEVQAHLFEPFFTTKPPGQGTGLGLATVYGIVTQSGGTIQVESAPGQGATFTISLPRVV